MYGIVYEVTSKRNPLKVRYVGQTTKTLAEREKGHYKSERATKGRRRTPMHKYLAKHRDTGDPAVFKEVARGSTLEELNQLEIDLIARYKRVGMADLNILPGGHINTSKVASVRRKMSEAQSGDKAWSAKLTWEEVREIRSRYLAGEKPKDIVKDYDTGYQNLTEILRNRTWIDPGYTPPEKDQGKPRVMTDEEIQEVRNRAQRESKTLNEWGRVYGIHGDTMRRVLQNVTKHDPNFDPSAVKTPRKKMKTLTEEDVKYIRRLRVERFVPSTELGLFFGVAPGTITAVLRNEHWKDDMFKPEEVVPYEGQNARGRRA